MTDVWIMRECVKYWLNHVWECEFTIARLEEIAARTRSAAEKTSSPHGEGVSGSGTSDAMTEALAKLEELDEQLATARIEAADMIAAAIETCERSMPRWVCYMHWAQKHTWAQVAREVNYSEEHVRLNIARQGVEELYPLVPEDIKREVFPNAAVL